VLQLGDKLKQELDEAYANSRLPEVADLTEVNEFLLRMRKENW